MKKIEKFREALEVFGLRLVMLETPEEKRKYLYSANRKGKIFLCFDHRNQLICSYTSIDQFKSCIQNKIAG